jgi:hypothetical protein
MRDTFKRVKMLQRSRAIAAKNDSGEWNVVIQVYVGTKGFSGDVVVPFGLDYEKECREIAEEFNQNG